METCREALERRQEGKAGPGAAGHKDHGRTILGMPLGLYLGVLALTSVCMYTGCVPKSLVPAFLVLMVFGSGVYHAVQIFATVLLSVSLYMCVVWAGNIHRFVKMTA